MKMVKIRSIIFAMLIVIFAVLVFLILGQGGKLPFSVIAGLGISFALLGIVLIALTVRLKELKTQKIFFILTGVSAAGIPVCAILHNVVYALFFHGKGGGDEAVFFILAIIMLPALFVIGTIGSIATLIYAAKLKTKSEK
ncbi:MAG TPA: hypothetical protein DDW84_02445 [Phycisphaerales bacterium]|nr:MAG: hypothetical protein A2Y13_04185 [Planctomycetes bacterium GWC2_45_44]HBG77697.1 hypothetical protein [Phycisphaerales bacterium]HBR20441.1 hypothetical protein [Phycisphaerales bacterium]